MTVVIEGVEGELLANVESLLGIKEVADREAPLPPASRLRYLHEQAPEDIRRALQPFGYFKPEVDSELVRSASGWRAAYRIEAGPLLKIAELDIAVSGDGADDPAFGRAVAQSPLAEGSTLLTAQYDALKQSLRAVAAERGYFQANFTRSQIAVDLGAYRAAIALHFDTGPRYRYGSIDFDQATFAPELLGRYLDFAPGDPYSAEELLELQAALISSGYFEEVLVSASPGDIDPEAAATLPVDVKLTPRRRSEYTFGIGYGTDTGVRGRAGLERRYVNRRGHRFEIEALASEIKYGIASKYTIPGNDPRTDNYDIHASLTQEDSDSKDTFSANIGAGWQREERPWLKRYGVDYLWERFTVSGVERDTKLLMPSLNWSRIDAPDALFVTNGSRFGFGLRGAGDFLFSDIFFLQATAGVKWIKSFSDKDRVILRGDAGYTLIEDDDFARMPPSLRFFTGGDRTVRGYDFESIGPRDADGEVIGGQRLLVGSVEYERQIRDKWGAAVFVDSGDAFDDSPDFKVGVGVGARWLSPVGPVRVDFAHGLDEPGDNFRIHLSIGPDL